MDPDTISLVGGRVANFAGSQGTNVPEASVGLVMPMFGFLRRGTFCIVLTLPNTVVQGTVMGGEIHIRGGIAASLAY